MTSPPPIDVILTTDRHQFVGIPALIRSVISNTEHPEAVAFHILVLPGETDELLSRMRHEFEDPIFTYEIKEVRLDSAIVNRFTLATESEHERGHLSYKASAINYSRFYLCDLFPQLDKIVYLDIDIIMQGDIAELVRLAGMEDHDLAAVSFGSLEIYLFEKGSGDLRDVAHDCPGFNNGAFVARLDKWRENGVVARFEHWMKAWCDYHDQHSKPLFCYGSQTVMNLAFQGDFQKLPRRWNVWGLGFGDEISEQDLEDAGILHWTGPAKPWNPEGLYKEFWEKYHELPGST